MPAPRKVLSISDAARCMARIAIQAMADASRPAPPPVPPEGAR